MRGAADDGKGTEGSASGRAGGGRSGAGGGARALLTGDAPTSVGKQLAADGLPSCALLKVGHHGSSDATSSELLSVIRPQVAVISCGRGNDYGHPHRAALQNYAEVGAEVWRTDLEGSLTFIWQNNTLNVETSADSADFAA